MKILLIILIAAIVFGCSPKQVCFDEKDFDRQYFEKLYEVAKVRNSTVPYNKPTMTCDTLETRVFRAVLVERYKMVDGIVMTTIENERIPSSIGLPYVGSTYRLYFIFTNYNDRKGAILIPSTYLPVGDKVLKNCTVDPTVDKIDYCVRAGPALVGVWGESGTIAMTTKLKWSTKINRPENFRWRFKKRWNKKGEVDLMINVKDEGFIICMDEIAIKEIFNRAPNDLGGRKPVSFDIEEIFGDERALVFSSIIPKQQ
jgi:hypothetical protein